MTDMGQATQILGIDIKQDLDNGTITLSREKSTLSVLKRFGMENCNPSHTSGTCLLYTSPSPRDATLSRMPSSA